MREPKITDLQPVKLVGASLRTNLEENKTKELWQGFGPKIRSIPDVVDPSEKWSVEIYDPGFDPMKFTPHTLFEKWAAVEVSDHESVPDGLKELVIPAGQYAVFTFKGLHSEAIAFMGQIFGSWLPASDYELDDRPHFEIMGPNYHGPFDPESEEDFWIPITTHKK